MEKININEYSVDELEKYIESIDEKKFHAKQIFKWIHKEGVTTFEEMSDISKSLRTKLEKSMYILDLKVIKCQTSKKDDTQKFLIALDDKCLVETVLMSYNHGNTLCVSTQVGCKMGCKFCASTKDGYERDLLASEIEGQIWTVQRYTGKKVSNVVYMGIGEPLDNYDNTVKSIRHINSHLGLNVGARHISISTCGVVDNIYKLADENIQATLSISLHETSDEERKKIMPIANKYTISQILEACKYYVSKTGRRISFEYALIDNVNDSRENALALIKLLRGMIAHVNLIPVNTIKNGSYTKSKENNIEKFMNVLNSAGIVTTVRRELGTDIEAACGQLRKNHIERESV